MAKERVLGASHVNGVVKVLRGKKEVRTSRASCVLLSVRGERESRKKGTKSKQLISAANINLRNRNSAILLHIFFLFFSNKICTIPNPDYELYTLFVL